MLIIRILSCMLNCLKIVNGKFKLVDIKLTVSLCCSCSGCCWSSVVMTTIRSIPVLMCLVVCCYHATFQMQFSMLLFFCEAEMFFNLLRQTHTHTGICTHVELIRCTIWCSDNERWHLCRYLCFFSLKNPQLSVRNDCFLWHSRWATGAHSFFPLTHGWVGVFTMSTQITVCSKAFPWWLVGLLGS